MREDGPDTAGTDGGRRVGGAAPSPYRYAEQHTPPEARRVSEVAMTTFEHVHEVDPRLMERWVLQQTFPNWDSLRLMSSRHDHLAWMHTHFAGTVVAGSELLAEVDGEQGWEPAADDLPVTEPPISEGRSDP